MSFWRRLWPEPEPVSEWWQLATYNAEVGRGLVHTRQWKEKMAVEQARFDAQASRPHPDRPIVKETWEK